jgi:signal transduction histidine kinase
LRRYTVWVTGTGYDGMMNINPLRSRVLWILVLNVILILIPISGFYFIYLGNYQSLQQRTMNLYNCNYSITKLINYINSEEARHSIPVLAPYQRVILVINIQILDSEWQSNPDFRQTDPFFAFVAGAFLKEIPPPDLKQKEILTRLSGYINSKTGKMGIIDYRFMYSVLPYYRNGQLAGSSVLLFDKSDIMRTNTLNKIMLAFISVVSVIIAVVISLIYYRLFIKPLFDLTKEARALRDEDGMAPDSFPLRRRKDEIGQLSQAFYQSSRELIDRKESVESFTGDVLHELKNPLTAIRNGVEILEQINNARGNVETGEILKIISRESGRIEKLLYDIKELSLYENQPTSAERCRPEEVIKEVASMYGEHGVRLVFKTKSGRSLALPREKLGCILKNLVDNAIDFSPAFGSVTIAYEQSDDSSRLIVSDLGKGIPDDEKRRVFERFYSNRAGTEAVGLHSGLGLSIVNNILKSYNYSIQCLDNQPSGCRFIITF